MDLDGVPRGIVMKDLIGTNKFEAITFTECNSAYLSQEMPMKAPKIEKSRPNCTNK